MDTVLKQILYHNSQMVETIQVSVAGERIDYELLLSD